MRRRRLKVRVVVVVVVVCARHEIFTPMCTQTQLARELRGEANAQVREYMCTHTR
jgi:hypothetical protein